MLQGNSLLHGGEKDQGSVPQNAEHFRFRDKNKVIFLQFHIDL